MTDAATSGGESCGLIGGAVPGGGLVGTGSVTPRHLATMTVSIGAGDNAGGPTY